MASISIGSDDESILSGSFDMTVRLWSAGSKMQIYVFKGHTNFVNTVILSSDIKRALSGSLDGTIKIRSI